MNELTDGAGPSLSPEIALTPTEKHDSDRALTKSNGAPTGCFHRRILVQGSYKIRRQESEDTQGLSRPYKGIYKSAGQHVHQPITTGFYDYTLNVCFFTLEKSCRGKRKKETWVKLQRLKVDEVSTRDTIMKKEKQQDEAMKKAA